MKLTITLPKPGTGGITMPKLTGIKSTKLPKITVIHIGPKTGLKSLL